MLQLSVVGYPFVNPGPVGGVGTFKNEQAGKVCIKKKVNLTKYHRDVSAVAPKFSDTLTLSQPWGADSDYHCRGRT